MPKTVLLADDSVTIQRVVELTFANEDVTVVSVSDGDQAIESINRLAPDLVLADIGMPGRSGYEVVAFVRSQPQFAALPVLLLAGAFEPADQAQAQLVGADGIFTKPFDPAVLIGRVNELLTNGRGATSVARPHGPSATAPEPDVALAPQKPAVPPGEGDSYFDQLDQAFAQLTKTPRPPLPPAVEEMQAEEEEEPATPAAPAEPPVSAAAASWPLPVPLTDAFEALLEAERSGGVAASLRFVPAAPPVSPAIDVDALAGQVARRVLEQLTDRVVRETVAEIVAVAAERLVREEIERIKRNIK